MKNISGRNPANPFKVILNLFVFTFALVGTLLSHVNPKLWSKLIDLPSLPPVLLNHPLFPYAAPILMVLSFIYFLTGYVFHPGNGKIRYLYILEGKPGTKKGPWMYAFDEVGVHEYDPFYETNPKIDYMKQRFQVVDLRNARVAWKKNIKSKKISRLLFVGIQGDMALFKSKALGPHAVNLNTGKVTLDRKPKTERMDKVPTDDSWMDEKMDKEGSDQTTTKVQQYRLPTGEIVELKGGEEKELWVNGKRRGDETFRQGTLFHNDSPGMSPALLENPRSVIIGHSRKDGGSKRWNLSRVTVEGGETLWTLEEKSLFPKKIKTDDGHTRMQALYANGNTFFLSFTTPRTYEDLAFAIDASDGRPLWKYVF